MHKAVTRKRAQGVRERHHDATAPQAARLTHAVFLENTVNLTPPLETMVDILEAAGEWYSPFVHTAESSGMRWVAALENTTS